MYLKGTLKIPRHFSDCNDNLFHDEIIFMHMIFVKISKTAIALTWFSRKKGHSRHRFNLMGETVFFEKVQFPE